MRPDRIAAARDLACLTPRFAAAALRVQRERAFHPSEQALARFADPRWLARRLGAPIAHARFETVHTGTATRSRLRIEYAGEPAGPTSLFVKSRPPDFASALFGVLFDLGANEVRFYRELAADVPVPTPAPFHAEGDSARYAVLLEDLDDGATRFATLASECSADEARQVVEALARLHAAFWESPRFGADLAWVRRFETNRDHRMLRLLRNLAVPIAFEKYGHVVPGALRDAAPELMQGYLALETQWAEGPRTLLHGDCHLGNLYFRDGAPGFLDWQVCQLGQGMRDVGYFLVNSVPEGVRREHQEALLNHYLAVLADAGVALPFDAAWRQYRLQSVYAWIAAVVTAPSDFQPAAVVEAGLARSSSAVLELDALALIRGR